MLPEGRCRPSSIRLSLGMIAYQAIRDQRRWEEKEKATNGHVPTMSISFLHLCASENSRCTSLCTDSIRSSLASSCSCAASSSSSSSFRPVSSGRRGLLPLTGVLALPQVYPTQTPTSDRRLLLLHHE